MSVLSLSVPSLAQATKAHFTWGSHCWPHLGTVQLGTIPIQRRAWLCICLQWPWAIAHRTNTLPLWQMVFAAKLLSPYEDVTVVITIITSSSQESSLFRMRLTRMRKASIIVLGSYHTSIKQCFYYHPLVTCFWVTSALRLHVKK